MRRRKNLTSKPKDQASSMGIFFAPKKDNSSRFKCPSAKSTQNSLSVPLSLWPQSNKFLRGGLERKRTIRERIGKVGGQISYLFKTRSNSKFVFHRNTNGVLQRELNQPINSLDCQRVNEGGKKRRKEERGKTSVMVAEKSIVCRFLGQPCTICSISSKNPISNKRSVKKKERKNQINEMTQ